MKKKVADIFFSLKCSLIFSSKSNNNICKVEKSVCHYITILNVSWLA